MNESSASTTSRASGGTCSSPARPSTKGKQPVDVDVGEAARPLLEPDLLRGAQVRVARRRASARRSANVRMRARSGRDDHRVLVEPRIGQREVLDLDSVDLSAALGDRLDARVGLPRQRAARAGRPSAQAFVGVRRSQDEGDLGDPVAGSDVEQRPRPRARRGGRRPRRRWPPRPARRCRRSGSSPGRGRGAPASRRTRAPRRRRPALGRKARARTACRLRPGCACRAPAACLRPRRTPLRTASRCLGRLPATRSGRPAELPGGRRDVHPDARERFVGQCARNRRASASESGKRPRAERGVVRRDGRLALRDAPSTRRPNAAQRAGRSSRATL